MNFSDDFLGQKTQFSVDAYSSFYSRASLLETRVLSTFEVNIIPKMLLLTMTFPRNRLKEVSKEVLKRTCP